MKLITHNFLTSKMLKNVVTGYPLKLVATKTEVKKSDFQPEFIRGIMKRIDYKTLFETAQTIGQAEGLVELANYNDELLNGEEFLKRLHLVLFEVEIVEGELICPETGRKFPINNGIPNMLPNDDEA